MSQGGASSSRSMVIPITVAVVAGGVAAVAATLIARRVRERRQFEREALAFDLQQIKESVASIRADVETLKKQTVANRAREMTASGNDLKNNVSCGMSEDLNQTHEKVERVLQRFRDDDLAFGDNDELVPLATSTPFKTVESKVKPENEAVPLSRVTSYCSMSSNEDYVDAVESFDAGLDAMEASFNTTSKTIMAEEAKPSTSSVDISGADVWSHEVRELTDHENFEEVDKLLAEEKGAEVYAILKKQYDESEEARKNPELLWRLAKGCHQLAATYDAKNSKKKELIFEGRKYAQEAYALKPENFFVIKWAAIMSGSSTDHLGTKEKIEEGYRFREFLDKALAIDANEFSLLHMRGRFAFSVANLSWIERKAAATFFAAPPTATIDEALTDFLAADVSRPGWLENLVYIARCYVAKKEGDKAVPYLKQAVKDTPADIDRSLYEEANALLKKHGK